MADHEGLKIHLEGINLGILGQESWALQGTEDQSVGREVDFRAR